MERTTLYVVVGRSGFYEDARNWNVAAFRNREDAVKWAKNASDDAIYLYENRYKDKERENGVLRRNKFDRGYDTNYYLPQYTVSSMDFFETK